MGDTITALCLSPVAVPVANLTWYINSDTADPSTIGEVEDWQEVGLIGSPEGSMSLNKSRESHSISFGR